MKVLNRSQITEVVTRRTVFHYVEYNGKKYSRILNTKVSVPFMDDNFIISKPKIEWRVYLKDNVVANIDKNLAKELETHYQELDIRQKNGDV
jgi:hypothetical protein